VIAEYRLCLKYPDGEAAPIGLRIGRPAELSAGRWDCRAEAVGRLRIDDSHDGPPPLNGWGGTSWEAMMAAVRFLYWTLYLEIRSRGAAVYDEGGQRPIRLEDLFPFRTAGAPPSEA
jgi:hypothetical protein